MKTMKQRVIAILCCVVLLVTSLYIVEPQKAEAAETDTVVKITTEQQGFNTGTGGQFVNLTYESALTDYASGANYFTETWVQENLILGGGMTTSDIMTGVNIGYVATNSIIQFNWNQRNKAFENGSYFIIKEGARFPYNTTAGTTAYITTDANYKVAFEAGRDATEYNFVRIMRYIDAGEIAITATGTSFSIDTTYNYNYINVTTEALPNYSASSGLFTIDETYIAEWMELEGMTATDVTSGLRSARHVIANTIQFTYDMRDAGWPEGASLTWKKGAPLYYVDANNNMACVTLDEEYKLSVVANTQATDKHHSISIEKIYIPEQAGEIAIGATEVGFNIASGYDYINITLAEAVSNYQSGIALDVAESVEDGWIQFGNGATYEQLTTGMTGVKLETTQIIQFLYQPNLASGLVFPEGGTITFKKGMPWYYNDTNGGVSYVTLDEDYIFKAYNNPTVTQHQSFLIEKSYVPEYKGKVSILSTNVGFTIDTQYNYNFINVVIDTVPDWSSSINDDFGYIDKDYETAGHLVFENSTVQTEYYTGLRQTRLETNNIIQFQYDTRESGFTQNLWFALAEGLPLYYNDTNGGISYVVLDKNYMFTAVAPNDATEHNRINITSVDEIPAEATFTMTTEYLSSFWETIGGEQYRYKHNAVYTSTKAAADTTSVSNILDGTGDAGNTIDYVDIFGMDADILKNLGISIIFYPEATTFQIVWDATVFDWIEKGMILTLKEGMPVYYANGDVMTLSEGISYQVTTVTQPTETGNGSIIMQKYEAPLPAKKYALSTDVFGTGSTGQTGLYILNPETGAKDVLSDSAGNVGAWLGGSEAPYDYGVASKWVDFMGFTAEEMEAHQVQFLLINNGEVQVLQIRWGTSLDVMGIGSQITFKEGMPFTYTNANGKQQVVELDKDYTFEVTGSNDGNKCVYSYFNTENSGEWALKYGTTFEVHTDGDISTFPYYNNINLSDSTLLNDDTAMRENVSDGDLMRYLEFGDIDPADYAALGIEAIVIIDGDTKVVQFQWGCPTTNTITDDEGNTVSTTDLIKDGDKIVFKAGMSVTTAVDSGATQRYVLDRNYSFTIETHTTGANGFRISGVVEDEKNIVPGDVDGDYLQNQNDISLLRKQLVNLISVSDVNYVNANEDADEKINSADLVHAKKYWDIEESEANGTESYTVLYEDCVLPTTTVAAGATITATDVASTIGAANYIRLTYSSTEDIYGTFYYTNNGTEYTENFYLPADDVQYEQFFDNYRVNGVIGTTLATAKNLTKITFKNVGSEAATFDLVKVEVATRTFENTDMVYVENGSLKIGVDLNQGGTLAYMQDLVNNPVEYTSAYNLKIATSDKYSSGSNAISAVNLVNIYDLGRQMQQSYYIDVLDADYTRGVYGDNTSWPYNPVQAGDENEHQSQIIDYRKVDTDNDGTQDMIYVKVRAMDWSDPNAGTDNATEKGTTTESYMENWYRMDGALLYIDNSFVDWSGWTQVGVPKTQELPAFYTLSSLNYFVQGNSPATRKTYGDWTTDAGFSAEGAATSDWYAWVNADADDAYGLGIYIPNAYACSAGRSRESVNALFYSSNNGAEDAPIFDVARRYGSYLDNFYSNCGSSTYQNCFLANTSYIAPVVPATLQEYTEYSYTYVLHANELDAMEATFDTIEAEGEVTNSQLSGW